MENSNEINDINLHSMQIAKLTGYYAAAKKNYKHLMQATNSTKELEAKRMHQLDTFRNLCMNQEKIISDLHEYKEKNDLLQKENAALAKLNHTLKQKLAEGAKSKAQSLQEQIAVNRQKLEEHERQAEHRVRQLDQQLLSVQATSAARITELQNKTVTLIREFDDKLQQANQTECQLRSQIDKLDKQLSLTVTVYQKKLSESEQRVAALEKERALHANTQGGFVTAQNLLDTQQTGHSTSRDLRQVQSYMGNRCENVVIPGNTRFKPFTLRSADILANGTENRSSNRLASRHTRPFDPSQTRPSDLGIMNNNHVNDNNRNMNVNAVTNATTGIPPVKRTKLYNPNR